MWAQLAGAGLGALKSVEDHKNMRKQNKMAALQTALSPWTKMGPGQTKEGPGLAGGLQNIAGGAMSMGQGAQQAGGFGQMFGMGKKPGDEVA